MIMNHTIVNIIAIFPEVAPVALSIYVTIGTFISN